MLAGAVSLSMSSLTQRWLRDNAQSYNAPARVYADLDAALARFPSLRPKSDVYTFDDGRTQLLLCLHGLLPITFRQASYNIPVAVWTPRDYPRSPPIAYVVPTADMLVKAGRHVDPSGRCAIDYIANWERKDEGCSMAALLDALQQHFSREPPVYAKPKDPYAGRPPPPLPPPAPTPTPTPPSSSDRPVLPTKPAFLAPARAPATPPLPLGYTYPLPQAPSFSRSHASTPSASASPSPPPPPLPPHPHFHPLHPVPAPALAPSYHHPQTQTPNPYPPPRSEPPLPIPVPPPRPDLAQHQHQQPPHAAPIPIPDLLDQDDPARLPQLDAQHHSSVSLAPPRPPNPELARLHSAVHAKLTSELNALSQALAGDAERLRAQQADLLSGEPAVRDEMARLEAVRDVCRAVVARLKAKVEEVERNVGELRRKGDPEVDELVCATSIVHNQLINLIADDNAIEDTIYHLHRALNAGRIDLERFLRSTRVLAEEQFMKRALIEKIQSGVGGLSGGVGPGGPPGVWA